MNSWESDLVVLVADKSMETALRALLHRQDAMRIRAVRHEVFVHPERDPGCLNRGHDFLRVFARRCKHGLIVFDHEGCGRESLSRESLEEDVESRLGPSGWGDRAAAVVIDPELEVWVWSDSPKVGEVLGWTDHSPPLRTWLTERKLWSPAHPKPDDPRKALDLALREVRKPHSSALFGTLASKVGLGKCVDPAFLRLKKLLQTWFAE